MTCEDKYGGSKCPTIKDKTCSPYQLTELNKSRDGCFIDSVVEESLAIGGADLHVFKLLGVHEQGKLIDLVGSGKFLSGGDLINFPASNAFEEFVSEWRSLQTGSGIIASSFIGYDFGEIKLVNRNRYGIETSIKHNISTLKIKQCSDPKYRVTRARVERSQDGVSWYGVAIIDLPEDDNLNTIHFKHSVPSRYWRLRPITFGGSITDYWSVQALQLINYDETSIEDIQDQIWLENRNRDYASESITLKGTYDLLDTQTELSRFGIELPSQQMYIHISLTQSVQRLGRPPVIGDIFEMPSELQYSSTMEPIKKYMEVTDVGWSTDGYTPGWQPTLLRIVAQPMLATEETQDIFGSMNTDVDIMGLLNNDDGNSPVIQDLQNASQTIQAEETIAVPERGSDESAEVHEFSSEDIQSAKDQGLPNLSKLNINAKGLYIEDGLPPNGLSYTEGDSLPETPSNEDYHRLTYTGLAANVSPRLFRYSIAKGRWIYLETDRRNEYNSTRPKLQEFLSNSGAVPPNKIDE